MATGDLVLGYDLGTSSLKAALVDCEGAIRASASAGYPSSHSQPGHAEQDPADWWRAMIATTRELLSGLSGARERVAAIGISAQMGGTVPVDSGGAPLHPCLIWLDTRSAPVARAISGGGPRLAGYGAVRLLAWLRLANGAPNLSGRDPLSKILWLREARPEVWRRSARLLDVKDWLVHRCTGEFATTPDVAQLTWLMDNRVGRRQWSDAWLDRFDIPREKLPAIVEAGSVAGTLTPSAAGELGLPAGVPVAGGAADINAAALAAGDCSEGAYHLSIGTGMWVAAHTWRRRVNPFNRVATLCAAHSDRYLLVATQESAGAAVRWAASTLGFGEGPAGLRALDAEAARARPGSDTPLFLPWLWGERVPVDDARLRGGLAGATLRTTRSDLAYAVLAGVALNTRWALAEAERCLRASPGPIRLAGGGAHSETWVRVLADMLQRPLRILDSPVFGGARGAAMTAATAAGWFGNLEQASRMARLGQSVEPDPARRAWADERYREFLDYWRSTRRWHARRETNDD